MKIFEMTVQVRVANFEEGFCWYKTLFDREPDFVPHDGFAEWELIPGCWLQVAQGDPVKGSGPLRLGDTDLVAEQKRLDKELDIQTFEIFEREEVPVRWATFSDPWGNRIGFFQYKDAAEQCERINSLSK